MLKLDNFKVGTKGLLIVVVLLLSQVIIVVFDYLRLDETANETSHQIHARRALERISLLEGMTPALVAQAKLAVSTGDKLSKSQYTQMASDAEILWNQFEPERGASAEMVQQIKTCRNIQKKLTEVIDTAFSANNEKGRAAALAVLDENQIKPLQKSLLIGLRDVKNGYRVGLSGPDEWQQEREKFTTTSITVLLVMLFLGPTIALLILNRGITRRMKVVTDNSIRLASNAPLSAPLSGTDEIAELDASFRQMAKALLNARDRERAVITNALDVICSLDTEKKFLSVNPSAARVWGYAEDELIGLRLVSIIHPDDIEMTQNTLNAMMEGESRAASTFENRVKCKDGGIAHMQWSVQFSAADKSIFCVVHDISERKSLEQLKEDFVAMISHDLRTPLTSIQLTLQMVSKGMYGSLNENGMKRVTTAGDSSERLLHLINQLLDVQKLESGKMEVSPSPVRVNELFEKSADAVRSFAEQHGITVSTEANGLTVIADGERIIQVLINLISNAVKFSPENGTVFVSAEEDGDDVVFLIKDQGRGVPEHLQASIFERFNQVDRSDEKQKGGTGLGLAICKLLVDAHGGSIGVVSEDGDGSTFWFRLRNCASDLPTRSGA